MYLSLIQVKCTSGGCLVCTPRGREGGALPRIKVVDFTQGGGIADPVQQFLVADHEDIVQCLKVREKVVESL